MCPIRVILISLLSGIVLIGSWLTYSEYKDGSSSSFVGKVIVYASHLKSRFVYPTNFVGPKALLIAIVLIASHVYFIDTDGIIMRLRSDIISRL